MLSCRNPLSLRMLTRVSTALIVAWIVLPRAVTHATVGDHPDSDVPGSHEAAIFSPLTGLYANGHGALKAMKEAVEGHHYTVVSYLDPTGGTDDHPGQATAANFRNLSGKGVVGIFTHAGPTGLVVEGYATAGVRDNNFNGYLRGTQVPPSPPLFKGDEIEKCDFTVFGADAFGICLTPTGIQRHFADKDTIVYFIGCSSFDLAGFFNAREYFGYEGDLTSCPINSPIHTDAEILWGRMHGKVNGGHKRAARVAYEAGGFPTGQLRYQHKAGKRDTVLSSAVKLHVPGKNESFAVPITVPGRVEFDARMDTSVPAEQVITVRDEGCLPKIREPKWDGEFAVKFGLELRLPGQARLIVDAKKALGERQGKKQALDGNNFGAGPDHIGPNEDNFEWTISCSPEEATWTPTTTSTAVGTPAPSMTQPPNTSTATSTSTVGPTPSSTSTVTNGPTASSTAKPRLSASAAPTTSPSPSSVPTEIVPVTLTGTTTTTPTTPTP